MNVLEGINFSCILPVGVAWYRSQPQEVGEVCQLSSPQGEHGQVDGLNEQRSKIDQCSELH